MDSAQIDGYEHVVSNHYSDSRHPFVDIPLILSLIPGVYQFPCHHSLLMDQGRGSIAHDLLFFLYLSRIPSILDRTLDADLNVLFDEPLRGGMASRPTKSARSRPKETKEEFRSRLDSFITVALGKHHRGLLFDFAKVVHLSRVGGTGAILLPAKGEGAIFVGNDLNPSHVCHRSSIRRRLRGDDSHHKGGDGRGKKVEGKPYSALSAHIQSASLANLWATAKMFQRPDHPMRLEVDLSSNGSVLRNLLDGSHDHITVRYKDRSDKWHALEGIRTNSCVISQGRTPSRRWPLARPNFKHVTESASIELIPEGESADLRLQAAIHMGCQVKITIGTMKKNIFPLGSNDTPAHSIIIHTDLDQDSRERRKGRSYCDDTLRFPAYGYLERSPVAGLLSIPFPLEVRPSERLAAAIIKNYGCPPEWEHYIPMLHLRESL